MSAGAQPLVGIVDYGMGNRRSVEKALTHLGARVALTDDRSILSAAGALILPGVGAFPRGMSNLHERGLDTLVVARARAGVPVLGICLGMQLLFDSSLELGETTGLGLIHGNVQALDTRGLRVPHIGWNEVRLERASPLTAGLAPTGVPFYHVHSFVAHPRDLDDVVGTAEYGERFASIVARENVYGVQFHPEKSSADGLELLRAFLALATADTPAGSQSVGAAT